MTATLHLRFAVTRLRSGLGQVEAVQGPKSDGGFAGRKRSSCRSGLRQFKRLTHLGDGIPGTGGGPSFRRAVHDPRTRSDGKVAPNRLFNAGVCDTACSALPLVAH